MSTAQSKVTGTVDSVSSSGALLVRGRWYEFPMSWKGVRPSAGQTVTVHYKVQRVIFDIQLTQKTTSPPPDSASSRKQTPQFVPMNASKASPPTNRSHQGHHQPRSSNGFRQTVSGIIAAVNARGLKLEHSQTWYNYSSFTPLPSDIVSRFAKGIPVSLTIDNGRWIAAAQIDRPGTELPDEPIEYSQQQEEY